MCEIRKARSRAAEVGIERTLFVVDIENMVGKSELTIAEVAQTQVRIFNAVPHSEGDHVILGFSHHNDEAAVFGWSGSAQRVMRSGEDGADLALLESLENFERVARLYETVVFASGDHFFSFAVARLKSLGCNVKVIAPDRGLSNQMRLAAGPGVVKLGSAFPAGVVQLLRNDKDAA